MLCHREDLIRAPRPTRVLALRRTSLSTSQMRELPSQCSPSSLAEYKFKSLQKGKTLFFFSFWFCIFTIINRHLIFVSFGYYICVRSLKSGVKRKIKGVIHRDNCNVTTTTNKHTRTHTRGVFKLMQILNV